MVRGTSNGNSVAEPYDPVYVAQSLLPCLVDFWKNHVLPAFEERDRSHCDVGWVPSQKQKRTVE